MKLTNKLLLRFLTISIVPLAIAGWVTYQRTTDSIRTLQYEKLSALAEERANKVEALFYERTHDASLLVQFPVIAEMLKDYSKAFSAGGIDSPTYKQTEQEHGAYLTTYKEKLEISDLLLITSNGDIVFSSGKKNDLGTNLRTGRYKESALSRIFERAMNGDVAKTAIVEVYEPFGAPVIFIAAPIMHTNGVAGILAFETAADTIYSFTQDYIGLGETGETVLASLRGEQVLLVAPTRHDPKAALLRSVRMGSDDAKPIQKAADGNAGTGEFTDYRGKNVLAAWRYLPTMKLGMVLKIDRSEAFAPAHALGKGFVLLGLVTLLIVLAVSLIIARTISSPIVAITRATARMAAGDINVRTEVHGHDEIGMLATAFNQMAEHLSTARKESEEKSWIKTGIAGLDDAMRGTQDLSMLCKAVVSYLARYMDLPVGTFFIPDRDGTRLNLAGSYACEGGQDSAKEFLFGEGLVGQVALEKKQILVQDIPKNCISVTSALGSILPDSILCIPLLCEDDVKGIIELGSIRAFTDLQLEFLDLSNERIAIAIQAMQAQEHLRLLLNESQILTEKLQTQQEELKTANEELEEQTQALQQSEEELKTQQEELQVTNEELEEKTDHLEQQRRELMDATAELEEQAEELALTSKYKSEFLANMSHELRTPLNSLLILAGILAENSEGNLSEDQVESAQVIHDSGKDLLSLINEILDISKIEAGQMDLYMETVPVKELTQEIHRGFKHVSNRKGLQLEIVVENDAPAVITSDQKRIGQILKNLISNAIKFTQKGGIIITFGSGELRREPCLVCSVKDTGVGIPKDKQRLIFEAFQQAESGTARKYGGTGLGLSISRELVHLLGGEIRLESEEGKGSVFRVSLPLDTGKKPGIHRMEKSAARPYAAQSDSSPALATAIPNPDFGTVPDDRDNLKKGDTTILVVEDDASFAKVLLDQCHNKNLKCLVAITGEEGVYLADKYLPAAVILDLNLPGIDGWSVLDQLKNSLETRHIPIHIMSAEDPSQNALNSGAIGFLRKPVENTELQEAFERIEDVLQQKMKKLLVIEDDANLRKAILQLIGNGDVLGEGVGTGKDALARLKSKKYDCIILDLTLPDMSGFTLLEKAGADDEIMLPPVIVYTGRELTRDEEGALIKYSESIIIKGVRSRERLFDETALFLHRMVDKMPEPKRQMIANLHDSDQMFKDKTVLIVDDDMRNLFALSNALSSRGIRTIKAQDGKKALEALEMESNIDLVLMDIMMPVMDGYETMGRIRKQEQFENLPVLALTAKAMKADRRKCIEAGASDYLHKPIDMDRLLSMMRVWMYR